MNESVILNRVAEGHEDAFRELYELYKDKVYYCSWKLLKSESAADDVLQDVFIKLWQQKEMLPGIKNFNAYLNTLVRNHLYNKLRKQASETSLLQKVADSYPSEANTTLDTVMLKESENLLKKALTLLPPQQQKAFSLSRLEGRKHEEIATLMNISKETVKKHIMEASKNIRQFFASEVGPAIIIFLVFLINK